MPRGARLYGPVNAMRARPLCAPVGGLRIDGSYSRFNARDALLNLNGSDFTSGHEDIYGGDADLQLDLAHRSSRSKMYLFGGAGWYRERTHFRQVSLEYATVCDPYFCEPGFFPVVTGVQRTTSPRHSSWNAGRSPSRRGHSRGSPSSPSIEVLGLHLAGFGPLLRRAPSPLH